MKKLMIYFCIIFFSSLLGCKDCCAPMSVSSQVIISYENGEGENLLNPSTEGHFNTDDIRIYIIENGEEKLYQNEHGSTERPFGFSVVSLSDDPDDVSIIYETRQSHEGFIVKLPNVEGDRITHKFEKLNDFLRITKVWVNQEATWEIGQAQDHNIPIVSIVR